MRKPGFSALCPKATGAAGARRLSRQFRQLHDHGQQLAEGSGGGTITIAG